MQFISVGENDGLYNGKRFFKCPPKHGLVVPLNQVALVRHKMNSCWAIDNELYFYVVRFLCQERNMNEESLAMHHPQLYPRSAVIKSERLIINYEIINSDASIINNSHLMKFIYVCRLMKQAEKLLPPSTMSSIMTPSPLIVKRSSADIYLSDHSIVSKKSAAGILSKNQSFRSTDVEVSSVSKMSDTPLPIQEISDQRSLDIPGDNGHLVMNLFQCLFFSLFNNYNYLLYIVTKGEQKISLASESSTVTEEAAAMEEEHVALPEEESPGSEKQPSSLFPTILKKPTSALSQVIVTCASSACMHAYIILNHNRMMI